ncbi:unnamed protein product [Zymoseptoria tritici ST99CH_3D1]|nr:unnamed protein product [Zymoseptoria tritici ST99CH_1E4]SMR54660.1 unnamed protein product [Zymoseptoria tritici ST99CH_3D1]
MSWPSRPCRLFYTWCNSRQQVCQASRRVKLQRLTASRSLRNLQTRASSTMGDNPDFYSFTRARFVQNEKAEMSSRRVTFNVSELANVAASSVGASCVGIERLPDGMHNRALLLTMDNGKQVVAKLPCPNAGQSHFTTASEVATMEFMRTRLNTPVPEVYAWCSHAERTTVGAEYIIMEKAEGVLLETIWQKMELRQQGALVKAIVRLQAEWASSLFAGYGSIYYATDLEEERRLPLHASSSAQEIFALGPITGRDWNDNGRLDVAFDRGPWKTVEQYLEAVGLREAKCVKELSRLPPPQVTLSGPGLYESTREKKLRALCYYQQIFRHLLPHPGDSPIRRPVPWHGDLHVANMFVDPKDPTKILSIIDWQSTEVAPLFVQARQPYIIDFEGPQLPDLSTEHPSLPEDFDQLSPGEQAAAHNLRLRQALVMAYRQRTRVMAPDIWKAFEYQATPAAQLLQLARVLLVDGEGMYTARIAEHLRDPDGILKESGISMTEAEMAEAEADGEKAVLGIQWMTGISDTIGRELFPLGGCVKTERYDESKDALRQCKEQVIEEFAKTDEERKAWEDAWPFDN